MKEVDFRDRVANHPGRIILTPVAGKADTYEMQRADDPIEDGTPLDKATFNSIIHSRLTGRYYEPSITREVLNSRTGITTNPIPKSGWVNVSLTKATNGEYIITSSSSLNNSYTLERATDGNQSTEWASKPYEDTGEWWQIQLPTPIVVTSIKANFDDLSRAGQRFEFKGSTNGTMWVTLTSGSFNKLTGMTQYTFNNTDAYTYYRLYFTGTNEYSANIVEFEIAEYSVTLYNNAFNLVSGVPAEWTKGQRITIQTPSNVSTAGAIQNKLNGKNIDVLLQPSKKYELVYNGASFEAKGV